jgi:hypothetical protein
MLVQARWRGDLRIPRVVPVTVLLGLGNVEELILGSSQPLVMTMLSRLTRYGAGT